MTYEYERTMLAEFRKGIAQFKVQLRKRSWLGAGIAPRVTTPVVGADTREGRDPRLHKSPVDREITQSIFYNYGGAAFAGAVQVKPVTA
jgi:hypothetical protein